ncbi:hypothetical protein N0B31_10215 [Salinirubellus salinus]|uniref:Uncharacterized protein n=1 Tax=Salinirubellus salinus TaxID=1364945 RepID=A0A9E7R7P9_9EURY|nr:hypothetical protein [Salinirubellus salinus]UWM56649.1 hypothetical protein N0B31_10215 [Salinirubellus salinus]
MGVLDYLGDSFGTVKDWTVDAITDTADLIVDEAENSINYGSVTPLEQMRGSVVIASLAIASSFVTFGATLAIAGVMGLTFLWGLGRWFWGLGGELR